jgi:sugar O-acyltransferase (sialic acid O-acetyltransferase NeuD family)
MNSKTIILGCGSQARYVIEALIERHQLHNNDSKPEIFLTDIESNKMIGESVNGFKVLFNLEQLISESLLLDNYFVIAHGENKLKEKLVNQLRKYSIEYNTVIHPRAYISKYATIGSGSIINSGAMVLPNAEIKSHCIIHSGSIVEHDCIINDYVNIAPGVVLAGRVNVGKRTYLYSGVTVIPGVNIGSDVIVGAGAVVLHDIPDGKTVVGVPAKEVKV